MRKEAPDMSRIDAASAERRPMRSPMWPQTTPPMGRQRNDSANSANVFTRAVRGVSFGKNVVEIAVAK